MASRTSNLESNAVVEFSLEPEQPFSLALTALALVRRRVNAIDVFNGGWYRRVVPTGEPGPAGEPLRLLLEAYDPAAGDEGLEFSAKKHPPTRQLLVRATGPLPESELAEAAERATTHLFGLDLDLAPFYRLASGDERLAPLAERLTGLRPPRYPSAFEALLNAVPCQQVTLVLGLTLLERLARRYGPNVPGPAAEPALTVGGAEGEAPLALPGAEALAEADAVELREMGLSGAKARTLVELAGKALSGELDLASLWERSDADIAAQLTRLFGVGRWTSEYVLLRGFGRLGVFPYGDSGARNGLARFLGASSKPSYDWVEQAVAPWEPYAGFVYLHLLVNGMLARGELAG